METPLITEEGGSGSLRGGRRGSGDDGYRRSKAYQTRSDAIAYGSQYQRAAALVDLAEDGVGLPEEVFEDSSFERAAKFYFMYIRFDLLWSLNLFALLVLNFIEVTLLFLLMCDLLVYAFYLSPLPLNYLPFRVAPYIRVAFIALNVSWLAYVTFEDTQQGKTMFTSFGTTLYQMFVLFTTSNNPDVWIPAYKSSRWSCLFFILYVLLGVYFITNLILAVVYDSFKAQLAKQVAEMDSMRIRILKKAFTTIDKYNHGFLNRNQCAHLFEELNKYRSLPKISKEDFESIFSELDDSGDFKINVDEFSDLCNAIALKFQKEPAPSWFESYPSFYHSHSCNTLKNFVQSSTFGYVVAFVLILNLVAVIIETTLDIQNSSSQKVWQAVEFFFGWLYVLEMALKIFSYGFDSYWMEGQNRFDFVVTWIIVIGETATFFFPQFTFDFFALP
ncbi:hypothetical protein Taro_015616 [Colocasia esculenta]|uniref:EF-hand domain-containing protein n=1 Tax=Colocasia esculenta TaxID=4460 RepID=A0A843UHW0_COLES|nr:hypothetical protein [Colocasia esculenta]